MKKIEVDGCCPDWKWFELAKQIGFKYDFESKLGK